ncbi:unnamed protein product [Calypogeia fissa]
MDKRHTFPSFLRFFVGLTMMIILAIRFATCGGAQRPNPVGVFVLHSPPSFFAPPSSGRIHSPSSAGCPLSPSRLRSAVRWNKADDRITGLRSFCNRTSCDISAKPRQRMTGVTGHIWAVWTLHGRMGARDTGGSKDRESRSGVTGGGSGGLGRRSSKPRDGASSEIIITLPPSHFFGSDPKGIGGLTESSCKARDIEKKGEEEGRRRTNEHFQIRREAESTPAFPPLPRAGRSCARLLSTSVRFRNKVLEGEGLRDFFGDSSLAFNTILALYRVFGGTLLVFSSFPGFLE